jgi:cytochrome oxidase Cu insertion factor (SCO1/SenC/PrrC family)
MRRSRLRLLISVGLGALALAGAAAAAMILLPTDGAAGEYRGSQPPTQIDLPDFTLPDYSGESVSSQELEGKVVLLTFLDSQCTEACPIIASQIARTLERLSPEERAQVAPIAISTDPEEDTPQAVASFLEKNRAVGKLRYLVAPVERLRPLWEKFQIAASLDTGLDTLHSAPVRIYDREGVWVTTLHAGADLTMENLAHDVRLALDS